MRFDLSHLEQERNIQFPEDKKMRNSIRVECPDGSFDVSNGLVPPCIGREKKVVEDTRSVKPPAEGINVGKALSFAIILTGAYFLMKWAGYAK